MIDYKIKIYKKVWIIEPPHLRTILSHETDEAVL